MPDGTYRATVRRPYGALELELMSHAFKVWKIFVDQGGAPKDKASRKFMGWLAKEPAKYVAHDAILRRMWGTGEWSLEIVGQQRS